MSNLLLFSDSEIAQSIKSHQLRLFYFIFIVSICHVMLLNVNLIVFYEFCLDFSFFSGVRTQNYESLQRLFLRSCRRSLSGGSRVGMVGLWRKLVVIQTQFVLDQDLVVLFLDVFRLDQVFLLL